MQCLCGYKHEKEWNSENKCYFTTEGDSEFVEIGGKFTIEEGDWHKNLRDITVYACPKCGTLRIDR